MLNVKCALALTWCLTLFSSLDLSIFYFSFCFTSFCVSCFCVLLHFALKSFYCLERKKMQRLNKIFFNRWRRCFFVLFFSLFNQSSAQSGPIPVCPWNCAWCSEPRPCIRSTIALPLQIKVDKNNWKFRRKMINILFIVILQFVLNKN